MTQDTGGPAFPTTVMTHAGRSIEQQGMTLRDYFATKAMHICPLRSHSDAARWCYQLADEMLKARG